MNNKLEQFIDYLSDEFDFEPYYEDGKYETVEETIQNCYKVLQEDELKDIHDNTKYVIKELEKYKGNNAMFCDDWSGIHCLGYVIFDNDFKYLDFIVY